MAKKKALPFYTDEELAEIKKQWLKDKARIDDDPAYRYYLDRDREYERNLCNAPIRALFRHAAFLKNGHRAKEVILYPREIELVPQVYRRIVENGYYSQSKDEEKKVRNWFAKAVSRQYYRKYGKS